MSDLFTYVVSSFFSPYFLRCCGIENKSSYCLSDYRKDGVENKAILIFLELALKIRD